MAKTTYAVPNTIANGDDLDATKVMGDFDYIENALNDFNGENITSGTILDAAFATSPETIRDETLSDQVISGLSSADPGATLTGVITAGVAYIEGVRVSVNQYSHAYTASKDCYVDLDKNGSFHVTEVANGAAAPAVYANSIRICKFVTNGTEITSYKDLRDVGAVKLYGVGTTISGTATTETLFKIQAGVQAITNDTVITFPKPFPNGLLTVIGCNGNWDAGTNDVGIKSPTVTGFTAACQGGPLGFNWIAIGW